MIKIKKAYTNFVNKIYLGRRAYFLELDTFGYEDKEEDVATTCASFPLIYIKGEEPFKQNKSISEVCKKIQKLNPYTEIIIETNGLKRPTRMNTIKNIQYIVTLKSKKSGVDFHNRVNENSLKWLSKAGAYIIFPVEDEDDFEEINTIMLGLTIKKKQIYINIKNNNFKNFAFKTMHYGFNIYTEYEGGWVDKKNKKK